MRCPRNTLKRAESRVRGDQVFVREVGDWLCAAGLLTIAVLVTMAPFLLL